MASSALVRSIVQLMRLPAVALTRPRRPWHGGGGAVLLLVGLLAALGCSNMAAAEAAGGPAGAGAGAETDVPRPILHPDDVAEPRVEGPLKLGILVSAFTATGPHWIGSPYGFRWHTQIISDIDGYATFELERIAIVDPGTADHEVVRRRLNDMAITRTVEGDDLDALCAMDVLVVHGAANMRDAVLATIHKANAEHGVGLWLGRTSGVVTPGHEEARVHALWGGRSGRYLWQNDTADAMVVDEHPIIAGLKAGDFVRVVPNGMMIDLEVPGVHAIPLIEISPLLTKARAWGDVAEGAAFAALYVAQSGKGRIVAIPVNPTIPRDLHDRTDGKFVDNVLRWLAASKRLAKED